MKKLLILPLLVLLTGCVTYYYPETAFEDGVYYAEDDPSYAVNQNRYIGVGYYPWASLDYFYLGYQPYPIYPYYYGFPAGFASGYSPWFYPFSGYGFYSPLYVSYYHYPFYPVWEPYGGYCSHHGGCGRQHDHHRGLKGGRFVGNQKIIPGEGEDGENRGEDYPFKYRNSMEPGGGGNGLSSNVYRSYMPTGYNDSRGLVVRSNDTTKIGKSLVQPVRSGASSNNIFVTAAPPVTGVNPPGNISSRRSSNVATASPSRRQTSRTMVTSPSRTSSGVSNRSRSSHSPTRTRSGKSGSSYKSKK